MRLHSEAGQDRCLRHLEESDRRFALILTNPWEWAPVKYKGLTVRFNVEWYERSFFEARRTAFQDPDHIAMYTQFGATLEDVTVEHVWVNEGGKETPVD